MSGEYIPVLETRLDWWSARTETDLLARATAAYQLVYEQDSGRRAMLRRHARMYSNRPVDDNGVPQLSDAGGERIRLNVTKAAVDTVSAKITKNRPKPEPLTTNGNWSMQRRAMFLDQFLQAQFYISRVPEQATLAFKDCAALGTGILKPYLQTGGKKPKIVVEHVYPGEILVENTDGMYADPLCIYRRKVVDRRWLGARYKKQRADIMRAGDVDSAPIVDGQELGASVVVVEAHRRESFEGAKDGRHIIFVDGAILEDEEWDECLPYVIMRWTTDLRGFWGIGLAEELTGVQVEINRLVQKIQSAMHLVSVPRTWIEEGSKVQKSQIDNRIGVLLTYRGTQPKTEVPQSVHPEMFAHLNWLWSRGFELAGVSQMNSGGTAPRLSAVALNTYHDIETERFATVGISWEQAHLDIATQVIALAKEANVQVTLQRDRYTLARVPWKDIDMDRDAYTLRVGPASDLPTQPGGRIEFVQQLIQAGMVPPDVGARLLGFQDVDREMALDRAANDNIERILERILDEGEYEAPEPYMDLDLAIKKAQAEYNRAVQYEDIDEERLELLRKWMLGCHLLLKAAMAEQQALLAAPAAGAPLPPGPDGQSPTAVTQRDGAVTSAT